MKLLPLVLVCAAAAVRCGNGALAPGSGTAPMTTSDAGSDAADMIPDVAFSDWTAATDVAEVASSDQSMAPDAATPEAGAADVPPGRVPYRAIAMSVGEAHVCVILDDHKVKCWGNNNEGQLGLGDAKDRGTSPSEMGDNLPTVDLGTGRTAKAISARVYTTCALLDDDSVKCWGDWWSATFPMGTLIGDEPGEMGDNLAPLDLGAGRKATSVVLGEAIRCVTTDDQSVLCWGDTVLEPMPVMFPSGTTIVDLALGYDAFGLLSDGSISNIWDDPPRSIAFTLDPGTHARALFAAYANVCATLDTGGLKCWILNVENPPRVVPPPTTDTDVEAVAFTMAGEVSWLTKSGAVEWANGGFTGARQPVQPGRPAVAIEGAQTGFCALLDDGSVKCWGATAPWMGGSDQHAPGWPAVNLGTRPGP